MTTLTNALDRIQTLYLSAESADVWFKFPGDRIPAHKLLLTTMNPWLKTMFHGALPEGDEVDMTHSNITAAAFKEFLRFIYLQKANLTMSNIQEIMDLAKQSFANELFTECEDFLIKTLTTDTMCSGYQLALLYDASRLKQVTEEEICVFAEQIFRSSSFVKLEFDFLDNILQCDALACDEKHVFNGCMAWAKAACERNNLDPTKVENLRTQLKQCIYQIRFFSMSFHEFAECIRPYPGLLTADEFHEIVQMLDKTKDYKAKFFNDTPRYYDFAWDKGRVLWCDRIDLKKIERKYKYSMKDVETTIFSCNQRVLLKSFMCECRSKCVKRAVLEIFEKKKDKVIERYKDDVTLDFSNEHIHTKGYNVKCLSVSASVELKKPILLRPNFQYEIKLTFVTDDPVETDEDQTPNIQDEFYHICGLRSYVLLDIDILVCFHQSEGFVSALKLGRFDNRNVFQKIAHNPILCALKPRPFWKR